MQEAYNFYNIIIIITFLGILVFIAAFINKKKNFFRNHLKSNSLIQTVSSNLIGSGNRATIFSVKSKFYLVISNRNSISDILEIDNPDKNTWKIKRQ